MHIITYQTNRMTVQMTEYEKKQFRSSLRMAIRMSKCIHDKQKRSDFIITKKLLQETGIAITSNDNSYYI